jgi:hypothetical protein
MTSTMTTLALGTKSKAMDASGSARKLLSFGLGKEEFMRRLTGETEAAADRILMETVKAEPDLPLPESAVARLKVLSQTAG